MTSTMRAESFRINIAGKRSARRLEPAGQLGEALGIDIGYARDSVWDALETVAANADDDALARLSRLPEMGAGR